MATENSLKIQPVPLNLAMVTVWFRFAVSFIIGPYFLAVMGPVTIAVTNLRYECLFHKHIIAALQQSGCMD